MTSQVFVGIPCFNRPAGLARTIECLQSQTNPNWTALISDNASPDPTVAAIAHRACASDRRFSYHRQPENVGAVANFKFVAERADRPYCMWASDDDLWKSNFIETCLNLLLRRPEAAMACGTISNINRRDLVIRNYRGFSRFTSGNSRHADARTFLLDPEAMGRANFIYGLYRTAALQRAIAEFWDAAGLGEFAGDCVFLYGFLCRYPIVATDEVLLGKRMDTDADAYTQRYHPKADFVSPRQYLSYVNRHVAVAPTPQFAQLARDVLRRRRIESRLFKYLSKLGLVRFDWSQLGGSSSGDASAFVGLRTDVGN